MHAQQFKKSREGAGLDRSVQRKGWSRIDGSYCSDTMKISQGAGGSVRLVHKENESDMK